MTQNRPVIIHTDGGAQGNPGPGGYGLILRYGDAVKELSAAYRETTNNRMELLACITALKALKRPCAVTLYSDSKYVVDGISKGWAKRWQSNGWRRNKKDVAENVDLWQQLLTLCNTHSVDFRWVKGHAGHEENERCDALVGEAIERGDFLIDAAYEEGRTKEVGPTLFG